MPNISVIITTYNWPEALQTVLQVLNAQSVKDFEVVIADDGSTSETQTLIDRLNKQVSYRLKHVWQEDQGFRAAKIRNKAIAASSGDYLIFIDHDCVPKRHFITQHQRLAETGYLVTSSRILLYATYTEQVIKGKLELSEKPWYWFAKACLNKKCNRFLPMLNLPIGPLRKCKKHIWKGTKNLNAIWKKDLIRVNGFNENYEGWGYEDTDLVVRLMKSGCKRKLGRFATDVIHLHHKECDKAMSSYNKNMLDNTINGNWTPFPGLDQYR